MASIFYDKDCDLTLLEGKRIAIIGYGSQGHAHALNLRDSGLDVVVGLKEGSPSRAKALAQGLAVQETGKAAAMADLVMLLAQDHLQADIFEQSIRPNLKPGDVLMFSHGFNIHYHQILPPADVDVVMVAPKGPGHTVREQYELGGGVPSLVAVHQDVSGSARALALAYAAGIGAGRAGILETTFREETETDLFGEQAVLCGGVTALMKAGFETLVKAGYQPESAYFECVHEMKLIVDLINRGGFELMRYSISDTAEYGDYVTGDRIITDQTKREMERVLHEIQSGQFASKWISENRSGGRASFLSMRRLESEHPVETVGRELRGMMSWLKDSKER